VMISTLDKSGGYLLERMVVINTGQTLLVTEESSDTMAAQKTFYERVEIGDGQSVLRARGLNERTDIEEMSAAELAGLHRLQPQITLFDDADIEWIFGYHAPTPEDIEKFEAINQAFIECAKKVVRSIPFGPGRAVAVRSLANARGETHRAIAMKGRF
jgi:hypothetical protein